ncbi:MAG: N-formylglutamate amidohydrolase [Chloroflexota bacterium]
MKRPIAIVNPHSGLAVPPELEGRLALTERQIFNEADIFAEQIYDFADDVLYTEVFSIARAIIDVNRPNDPSRTRPGDGIVKRQTSYGAPVFLPGAEPDAALEQLLIEKYWQPWHDMLDQIANDSAVKFVLDAHTMAATGPDKYNDPHKRRPRVAVCNLGDKQGLARPTYPLTASTELMHELASRLERPFANLPSLAQAGPAVAINDPFWGGWNLYAHGGKQQPWVMMEISRAMYVGDQTGETAVSPPQTTHIEGLKTAVWQALDEIWTIASL